MAEERRIFGKQARVWYALFLMPVSDIGLGKPLFLRVFDSRKSNGFLRVSAESAYKVDRGVHNYG